MTVNSLSSFLILIFFLTSVYSVQNSFSKESSEPVCSYPYSCILTKECAERHSARGTQEVLFQCEGKQKICCPPLISSTNNSTEVDLNNYETTEIINIKDCQQNPFQSSKHYNDCGNRTTATIQGNEQNVGIVDNIQNHKVENTTGSKQPSQLPSESRRPTHFQQSQHSHHQQPQHSHHHQNFVTTQKPSNSQNFNQRPQNFKNSSQTLSVASQSKNPENSYNLLSSHRNFRLLPKESNCGVNNFANRITEGEEVSLGEYPWMALTGLKDKYGNYRWNCGGTLINGRYVLTAAHCLIVDNRTIEYVRLGEHSLSNETDCNREVCLDPPEDIAIAEVIPHEKWNTTTIKNDIALLRLSKNPLKLGNSNIYPICLPMNMDKLNITPNTKFEVAGWGKTDWNADEGSDVLRKASISGVNREECNICKDKKKQQYCPLIDTQVCVQGWKSVDVCKGDSGGPLMVTRLNIYQIGITSFKGSEYCGAENIPSIFTKVESFLPWILDNIRE